MKKFILYSIFLLMSLYACASDLSAEKANQMLIQNDSTYLDQVEKEVVSLDEFIIFLSQYIIIWQVNSNNPFFPPDNAFFPKDAITDLHKIKEAFFLEENQISFKEFIFFTAYNNKTILLTPEKRHRMRSFLAFCEPIILRKQYCAENAYSILKPCIKPIRTGLFLACAIGANKKIPGSWTEGALFLATFLSIIF